MHEMPDLLENQNSQQVPMYPDSIDMYIDKELIDCSVAKETPSADSQGITPHVSHISNYSYHTAGNPSYCFTDDGSHMNGLDSILPGLIHPSNLSMENDTDQTIDSQRKMITPRNDTPISECTVGIKTHQHNSESGSCPALGQRSCQTLPPPLPDPFCDSIKELACSSMLEQTPVHPTEDKEQSGPVDIPVDCSQKQEGHHHHIQRTMPKQGRTYATPIYSSPAFPFLPHGTPQQYESRQPDRERSITKCPTRDMRDRYIVAAEKPYIYPYAEQSNIHRQMNYQLFMRSYQYFYGLNDEELDLQQDVLTSRNNAITPQYSLQERVTSSTLYKGLFCANKECCGLLIDNLTRSPYCSKQCQVREQNMRQARVKPRETLIRRKDSLFRFLRTLPELSFERAQIIPVVRSFLRGGLGARLKQSD